MHVDAPLQPGLIDAVASLQGCLVLGLSLGRLAIEVVELERAFRTPRLHFGGKRGMEESGKRCGEERKCEEEERRLLLYAWLGARGTKEP